MPKKKPMSGKPEVHKDLEGFEMSINEFGEIKSNFQIEELNKFLNKNVDDKKFRELEEIPYAQKGYGDDDDDAIDDDDDDDDDFDDDEIDIEELDDDDIDDKDNEENADDDEIESKFKLDDNDEFEDIEQLVKDMESNIGKKGRKKVEEVDEDFNDEEFIDKYADEYGEGDDYNFED